MRKETIQTSGGNEFLAEGIRSSKAGDTWFIYEIAKGSL
jgi:hypothetical protein